MKRLPSIRAGVRARVLSQSTGSTISLFQQHISLKTRYTYLTFSSGIPLHSVVSYTEQSQAGRGMSQLCVQIISFVSVTLLSSSMRLSAIKASPNAVSLSALGSASCWCWRYSDCMCSLPGLAQAKELPSHHSLLHLVLPLSRQDVLPNLVLTQHSAWELAPPLARRQAHTLRQYCASTRCMSPAGCRTPPSGWPSSS